MNVHIYVVGSSGKIVCPGLPFFLVELQKGEGLGPFATDRCSDKCLSSPFGMYGILLTPWQIGLPKNHGCTHCHRGPGMDHLTLPLSAPYQQHIGTCSCRIIALWGVPSSHLGYSSKKESDVNLALWLHKLTCCSLQQNPGLLQVL